MKFKLTVSNDGVFLNGQKAKFMCRHSRDIYVCGKFVIKVEHGTLTDADGDELHDQCLNEWETYRNLPKGWKHRFARVYKYGILRLPGTTTVQYVIQEYVKPRRGRRSYREQAMAQRAANRCGIWDLHAENWCVNNRGKVKILDLGLSNQIEKRGQTTALDHVKDEILG